MSAAIEIDTREFMKAIKDWEQFSGKESETALRQQMRLLNKRLMDFTPPKAGTGEGTGVADKKAGEGAVSKDLSKIFSGMSGSRLRMFMDKYPDARTSDGMPLFDVGIDPSFHKKFRNQRGRVKRDKNEVMIDGKRFFDRVHIPKTALNRYRKFIQGHVGKAKAGWNAGKALFRSTGFPAWVTRHGTGQGRAQDTLRNGNGYLMTENMTAGAGARGSAILQKAVTSRIRDIYEAIRRGQEAAAKKVSAR
jgi:hypothetical protein